MVFDHDWRLLQRCSVAPPKKDPEATVLTALDKKLNDDRCLEIYVFARLVDTSKSSKCINFIRQGGGTLWDAPHRSRIAHQILQRRTPKYIFSFRMTRHIRYLNRGLIKHGFNFVYAFRRLNIQRKRRGI